MTNRLVTADLEATIRLVLRQYPIDHDRVFVARQLPTQGFSGALIVQVHANRDEAYCLRRWPLRELPRRRIVELHRFLRFLRVEGVECLPVPLATLQGETLAEHDVRLWQLEQWMPGTADFHQAPTDNRLESIMRLLARLHNVASRYEPTDAGREWFGTYPSRTSPAIGERIAVINRWTNERLDRAAANLRREDVQAFREAALDILDRFRQSFAQVRAELQRLSQSAVYLHPCMRDVWHDHVLFTSDEVTGLIDPAATRTESVATDLSRLLGSLLGDMHDERWGRALESYDRVRSLTITEHQLIGVLHVSGVLLSGMTWIERRVNGTLTEEMLPRVVDRLHSIRQVLNRCQ